MSDKCECVACGEEFFWNVELGYGLDSKGRYGIKASYHGARGDDTSLNFFATGTNLSRDIDQIDVAFMVSTSQAFIEFGWAHVLASQTFPAAPQWSLGVSRNFQLFSR